MKSLMLVFHLAVQAVLMFGGLALMMYGRGAGLFLMAMAILYRSTVQAHYND